MKHGEDECQWAKIEKSQNIQSIPDHLNCTHCCFIETSLGKHDVCVLHRYFTGSHVMAESERHTVSDGPK